jgi:NADH-quinone oxidoreductase subunit N
VNYLEYFLIPVSPVLAVITVALLLILAECLFPDSPSKWRSALAFLGPMAGIAATTLVSRNWPIAFSTVSFLGQPVWLSEFARHYHLDMHTVSLYWAINVFVFFSFIFLDASWPDDDNKPEVFILMLFVAAGMMLLVSADSLLMVFTALELLSLPTYILVALRRKDAASSEAALKYFLFGSLATVILLLGIAFLYAQFGSMHLPTIMDLVRARMASGAGAGLFFYAALALFVIGVGFKVGIAPFHMWVPDTYEGSPSSITGFMGSAVKLAGFGLAMRLWWGIFLPAFENWATLLAVLAVITMFVGNIAALAQENLKRMFAYSSIAHAGYLLLGLTAVSSGAPNQQPMYFYLVTYGFMFLGFFGVLSLLEKEAKSTNIDTLSGLGFTHPFLAICLTLFALSAAGIPPTAGFIGKYFLFLEAVKAGRTGFVILAVISSVIGVYYYLRVVVYLFMKEGATNRGTITQISRTAVIGIAACAFCMLYFGLMPYRLGM